MGSRAFTCTLLYFFLLTLNFSSFGLPQSPPFLSDLHLQCPLSIPSSPPLQMNGEVLERALSSRPKNLHTAVLFYGSWCPFSSSIRDKFNMLCSVFPQIEHIEIEESSATPSLLSRYGVHSLPALLIISHTAKVQYHGQKDLHSLARFYHKTTGLDSTKDVSEDRSSGWVNDQDQKSPQLWYQASSWKEMIVKEPYFFFAISFLMLRAFLYVYPRILGRLVTLWNTCKQHLNLGVFGESGLFLGRVMQIIDLKRVWHKIKWCKTRNFLNGARSARVWASSLASVSLGETSSARSTSTMLDS